jgi:hypothetical protein
MGYGAPDPPHPASLGFIGILTGNLTNSVTNWPLWHALPYQNILIYTENPFPEIMLSLK